MVEIDPERRISALDALFHDFFIVNKVNNIKTKRKTSLCFPSVGDFLSNYSLDMEHKNSVERKNKSALSINPNQMLNWIMAPEKSEMDKIHSDSTNDVGPNELYQADRMAINQFSLLFPSSKTEIHDHRGSLIAVKKSKFAN
jgi:hypothetical protein